MPKVYAEFYNEETGSTRSEIQVAELRGQILIQSGDHTLIVLDPFAARQLADELHLTVDYFESEA